MGTSRWRCGFIIGVRRHAAVDGPDAHSGNVADVGVCGSMREETEPTGMRRQRGGPQVVPRVTIGMPVYNGAEFLSDTLISILEQTYTDFILHISDNASVDETQEICEAFARSDKRVVYERNECNVGATLNFNRLAALASGEYFMWAAHDDRWHPSYLDKAVAALDSSPSSILCYAGTQIVNERDETIASVPIASELESESPARRFRRALFYPPQSIVFGLVRTRELRRTRLLGNYSASDQVLAGELALQGTFIGLQEYLFYYRRHKHQSTGIRFPTMHSRMAWFDPANSTIWTFPHWRLLVEHLKGAHLAELGITESLKAYAAITRWVIRHRRVLGRNLLLADRPVRACLSSKESLR